MTDAVIYAAREIITMLHPGAARWPAMRRCATGVCPGRRQLGRTGRLGRSPRGHPFRGQNPHARSGRGPQPCSAPSGRMPGCAISTAWTRTATCRAPTMAEAIDRLADAEAALSDPAEPLTARSLLDLIYYDNALHARRRHLGTPTDRRVARQRPYWRTSTARP